MAEGSSPLTRGKPLARTGGDRRRRLIPAHAGKTACSCAAWTRPPAHPRSRGENPTSIMLVGMGVGSSPLTRGKLGDLEDVHARVRLIPAHAGKTRGTLRTLCERRAHPRSRGENMVMVWMSTFRLGSSPLTRGKRSTALSAGRP